MCIIFLNSLQVQVHQKRAQDPIQGCTEAGDQTQTPVLPGEDDIVSQTDSLSVCHSPYVISAFSRFSLCFFPQFLFLLYILLFA